MTATSSRTRFLLAATLVVPALLLAGCGPSRDTLLSEKLMAAQNAAARAEKASLEAQKAAAQIATTPNASQVVVEEVPADAADETVDGDLAENSETVVTYDNDIVSPPALPPAPPA